MTASVSEHSEPDPTRRFTDRVDDYVRYRPGYPPGVLNTLRVEAGLRPDGIVVDVGSGTGLWSAVFLEHGNTVYAVEPNPAMRTAAEARFGGHPRFRSLAGTAEALPLPDETADLVTAAQAFHWFDSAGARAEFSRVLRTGGHAALVWNLRHVGAGPFMQAYEALLRRYGTDYGRVSERYADEKGLADFFGEEGFRRAVFHQEQILDLQALEGLLLSASYAPGPRHPDHAPMLGALHRIFHRFAEQGVVRMAYETLLYYGRLES